jgi:hypothetical protein
MNDPFERALSREKLERRERRTRHVAACFKAHLRIFVIVNAALILIWFVDGALDDHVSWGDAWFVSTLLGWGAGVAFHWWHVRAHVRRDARLRTRLEQTEASA